MKIVEKLKDLSSRMRSDASNDECTPDGIMGQTLNSYADEIDSLAKDAIEIDEGQCGNPSALREALDTAEENNKTEYRPTLWYAVVHFGSKETDTSPCFLKRIPYMNANGNTENEYHHFTYGMDKAALFDSTYKADEARRAVEKRLSEEGHRLAGHVKVMQLFGLVRDSGSEE